MRHSTPRTAPARRARMLAWAAALALGAGALAAVPATVSAHAEAAVAADPAAVSALPTLVPLAGAKLQHPGILVGADDLERVRAHVLAGDEPWASYFRAYAATPAASKSYVIANDANPGSATLTPKYGYADYNTGFFNNQMSRDAGAAYTQAVMYWITGDPDYRATALRIVRLWSMLDPSTATPVVDAHIQMGPPMLSMNTAAELLRATSSPRADLDWTQADTDAYAANYIAPPMRLYMHKNDYLFNQHQTALMAAMSSYIFLDDEAGYRQAVEWFTVNSTVPAASAYANGSLQNTMFETATDSDGTALPAPVIVVKEMQRDQPHSAGDITGLAALAKIVAAQGTRVDPTAGTVSTASDAVAGWDFGGDRLLRGTNLYAGYNLGYDVPFNDGKNSPVSDYGRGRYYNFAAIYYHFRYARGYAADDDDMRYLAAQFAAQPMVTDDTWLTIPDAAAGSPLPSAPADPSGGPYPFETRTTAFDDHVSIASDDSARYAKVTPTAAGTVFAVVNQFSWRGGTIGLRIRTDARTTLELRRDHGGDPISTVYLPDTDGAWRYATFSIASVPAGRYPSDCQILFFTVKGAGGEVDFDQMTVASPQITPPTFAAGTDAAYDAWAGGPLSLALPATDSAADTVSYALVDAPEGAAIDAAGTLTWTPSRAGTATFFVQASDGTTVTLLKLTIDVAADYAAALRAVIAPYDRTQRYETATLAAYRSALAAARAAEGADRNTALLALRASVDGLRLLTPTLADGGLDLTRIATGTISAGNIANLVDGDGTTTTGDLFAAADKSFTLDFGTGFRVASRTIGIVPRTGFPARSAGMVAFGSQDGIVWDRLTGLSANSTALQTLAVRRQYRDIPYRYLRFKDLDGDVLSRGVDVEDQPFSLGELRISGTRSETVGGLGTVSIASGGEMADRAVPGDTVTVRFAPTEAISRVTATIGGRRATVSAQVDGGYTASTVLPRRSTLDGPIPFAIDYRTADRRQATPVVSSTDGSTVFASPARDEIIDVPGRADVTVSSGTFAHGDAGTLFDGTDSYTEYTQGGGGSGAWESFDFARAGATRTVTLDRVELLARTGWGSRAAGTVVQGSKDGTTWTTITSAAVDTARWQALTVPAAQRGIAWRYLRVTNPGAWYGNLAELRFFGSYGAGQTDSAAPTYTVKATASPADGGTVALGLGDAATAGTTRLDRVSSGSLVTAVATPKEGYTFVEWTRSAVVEGVRVDVHVSTYPTFIPGYWLGGYNGGTRVRQVVEDWNLTAHFGRIEEGDDDE